MQIISIGGDCYEGENRSVDKYTWSRYMVMDATDKHT